MATAGNTFTRSQQEFKGQPAGKGWQDPKYRQDAERRKARSQLMKVNSEGKRCLVEYAKDEKAFNSIQNGIAMKEAEMSNLNAALQPLQVRSRMFANADEEIPKSLAKGIEQLNAAWVDAAHERLRLKQHEAQKRMSLIKLAAQIDHLRHSQVNLEAAAKGEPVAPGWEGGVFRI